LFDLLIIPLLLYRKTRTAAILAALFFPVLNAVFLQIVVYPCFDICCFFLSTNIHSKTISLEKTNVRVRTHFIHHKFHFILIFYSLFHHLLALPIRHWSIPHDVLSTEELHRLNWLMMLRSKQACTQF
jgi:hypothetical protein